ncbi:MAG: hypothetical protein L6455_14590 [Kiritimatiellae bacterium]|nr:hypothetical protein [Kiritimatiellia bacterium]
MRVSVLIGLDQAGKWDAIALPDRTIDDQKNLFKQIILSGGKLESGKKGKPQQFQKIMRFDRHVKRASFRHPVVAPVTPPQVEA